MKKYTAILGKLFVAFICALACWLLYHKLKAYSLHEIIESILCIHPAQLAAGIVLVIINYIILIGYDWLAIKAIHRRLSPLKICFVSFTGCAVSYNLGAILGGTTVRYRLYSAWGFHPLDIIRLVLMLAVTFWIGALGLAGGVLLFANVHVPPELGISPAHIKPVGGMLFALAMFYLFICWKARGRSIMLFKKEFSLPTLPIAFAQTCVASADLLVAAACLYVLLPADASISFADFLPSYLLAQVAVVLTHVPGGVGVLEVILMHIVHGVSPELLFGAVLVFRVLYYLIPLALSAVMLLSYEVKLRKRGSEQQADGVQRTRL